MGKKSESNAPHKSPRNTAPAVTGTQSTATNLNADEMAILSGTQSPQVKAYNKKKH